LRYTLRASVAGSVATSLVRPFLLQTTRYGAKL